MITPLPNKSQDPTCPAVMARCRNNNLFSRKKRIMQGGFQDFRDEKKSGLKILEKRAKISS